MKDDPATQLKSRRSNIPIHIKTACFHDYCNSSLSKAAMAAKYSVSTTAISAWIHDDGWLEKRKAIEEEALKTTAQECLDLQQTARPQTLKRHIEASRSIEDTLIEIIRRIKLKMDAELDYKPSEALTRMMLDLSKALDASGKVSTRAAGLDGSSGAMRGLQGRQNAIVQINLNPTPVKPDQPVTIDVPESFEHPF